MAVTLRGLLKSSREKGLYTWIQLILCNLHWFDGILRSFNLFYHSGELWQRRITANLKIRKRGMLVTIWCLHITWTLSTACPTSKHNIKPTHQQICTWDSVCAILNSQLKWKFTLEITHFVAKICFYNSINSHLTPNTRNYT